MACWISLFHSDLGVLSIPIPHRRIWLSITLINFLRRHSMRNPVSGTQERWNMSEMESTPPLACLWYCARITKFSCQVHCWVTWTTHLGRKPLRCSALKLSVEIALKRHHAGAEMKGDSLMERVYILSKLGRRTWLAERGGAKLQEGVINCQKWSSDCSWQQQTTCEKEREGCF